MFRDFIAPRHDKKLEQGPNQHKKLFTRFLQKILNKLCIIDEAHRTWRGRSDFWDDPFLKKTSRTDLCAYLIR